MKLVRYVTAGCERHAWIGENVVGGGSLVMPVLKAARSTCVVGCGVHRLSCEPPSLITWSTGTNRLLRVPELNSTGKQSITNLGVLHASTGNCAPTFVLLHGLVSVGLLCLII